MKLNRILFNSSTEKRYTFFFFFFNNGVGNNSFTSLYTSEFYNSLRQNIKSNLVR
jgi:predicted N-acyltransferase